MRIDDTNRSDRRQADAVTPMLWGLAVNHIVLMVAALGFEQEWVASGLLTENTQVEFTYWYGSVLFPIQWLVECLGVCRLGYVIIIAGETRLEGYAWPVCLATGGLAGWYALV
ncbi:hypothetical protein L4C36_16080 [Photobacterium japonica]|uniref:hypothetical protein n=1 Tax=Photobacterium japonica TaxID=2910235 RepID=UPI003D0D6C0C